MSKHLINQTNVNGIEMVLECGYDRPTGSFFANIHSEGDIYYTSLAELGSKDSGWLLTVTAEHGLVVPRKMMDRLAIEAMFDGSNDFIEHEPYTQTESDRRLLQLGFRQQMPSVLPTDNPVWAWFTDSEEDLGTYALLQSKDYQAYVPSLLCDVLPQEGEWPVLDEQDVLKRLDTMHARLLKGAFQKHPGEGIGSVLNRILGFVPPILQLESKLFVVFSDHEFVQDKTGFWAGDCWAGFSAAKVFGPCEVTAEEGENCIPIHEAYALASGALLKVQSFGVKSIADDDLCASCGHCNYRPGDMSSCSKDEGKPG